jgi:glycosyltransferase involved in cell wall biosynthesis
MFSVVIPLYNKSHTIVETVQSVLSQDLSDFELIIVDDGSTDGGPQKVENAFNDPRIRLMYQEHQGVSAARNRGVACANSELIAFLDGDDLWFPAYLTRMKEASDEFPDAGMYCCAGYVLYPDGSGVVRQSPAFGTRSREVDYFQSPSFFGHTSFTIVRKSHVNRVGGFPVGMAHFEDHVVFHAVALQTTVVFCPTPLGVVHKGFVGQASNDRSTAHIDHVDKTNAVYGRSAENQDATFIAYTLHDLRCNILSYLTLGEYAKVGLILDRLDPRLATRLNRLERFIYRKPVLRPASVLWIYGHKCLWRLRRYPRAIRRKNLRPYLPSTHTSQFMNRSQG